MNEFEKNQDKGTQTDQQGDKPAFGQLDKEQGQQQEQSQPKQQQDELADADQQGDDQIKGEGEGDQQR